MPNTRSQRSTTRSFLTLTEFLECVAGCQEKISVCISFTSFCFCYLDIGIGQPRWCSKCLETGNPRLGSSDGGWLLHCFLRFCATFVARNKAWPLGCMAFSEWLLGHETWDLRLEVEPLESGNIGTLQVNFSGCYAESLQPSSRSFLTLTEFLESVWQDATKRSEVRFSFTHFFNDGVHVFDVSFCWFCYGRNQATTVLESWHVVKSKPGWNMWMAWFSRSWISPNRNKAWPALLERLAFF